MEKLFYVLLVCWLVQPVGIVLGDDCNTQIQPTTPSSDFIPHGDGTVTHLKTGLMWKRCSEGKSWINGTCSGSELLFTWGGALTRAESSTFANYSDWRLPNIKELASILERSCFGPTMNNEIFPYQEGSLWSSSPSTNSSAEAWCVFIYYGDIVLSSRTDFYSIRLVRGGD